MATPTFSNMYVQTAHCMLIFMTLLSPFFPLTVTSSFETCSSQSSPLQASPRIDSEAFVSLGDINIGAFLMMTYTRDSTSCSKKLRPGSVSLEFAEAIAYTVKLVNENPYILPNITLGYVILNDCTNTNVALAKALQFLPRYSQDSSTCDCNTTTSSQNWTVANSSESLKTAMNFYDVVGCLAPMWSSPSVVISQLFSTAKIPLVGQIATSDELSDKNAHPYFLRISSPDKYQVISMLKFIQSNGWSYISVLYAFGSFGEKGYDSIKSLAPSYGICIAYAQRVNDHTNFSATAHQLLAYKDARVVILFVYLTEVRSVLTSIEAENATGKFIWIGGSGWGSSFRSNFKGYENLVVGSFYIAYHHTYVTGLYDFIKEQESNMTASPNPWLLPYWEQLTGCDYNNVTCRNKSMLTSQEFAFSASAALYHDGVMTFAYAIDQLISDLCPNVSGHEARSCIQGDTLLRYLWNVSFEGYSGHIEFNQEGDVEGQFEIQQITMDYKDIPYPNITSTVGLTGKTVAIYDVKTKQVNITGIQVSWDHLLPELRPGFDSGNTPQNGTGNFTAPDSVCSRPCLPGEFKIQKEVICCWDCRKCRDNERLVDLNTNCEDCSKFTWPDPETGFTTCKEIALTYPSLSDTVSVIQICVGLLAIICAVIVASGYIYFRDSRVIKAASKELSILQMVAIVVGYITVILFQFPPSHGVCASLYFLFCLSFAWLYAPLIVKALRVYRIFLSGAKRNTRPRFISPRSQVILTMVLIGVQIILCVVTFIVYKPTAKKTQPILTEKFVELSCDMTLPGLASFLAYNLVLVFFCAVFAFATRKLPDNFNESWFMFMCVSTTLVIWMAFIPTYFTASRESIRILMLSVALLLNHTVALVFLFLPKIYAAVYLPSTPEVTATQGLQTQATNFARSFRSSGRVAPAENSSPTSREQT